MITGTFPVKPGGCEEAALGVPFYAPCNRPAVAMVGWKGRDDRPIPMCEWCMDHNVKNRGGTVVKQLEASDAGEAIRRRADKVRGNVSALRGRVQRRLRRGK